MYLKGSKWSYTHKRSRPANPFRLFVLVALVGSALYVNQVVVPTIPPPFVPTATPNRPPESFVTEAENFVSDGKISKAIQAYESAIQADPKNPSNYITLARLQIYAGNYTAAITNTENAMLLSQNNSMAYALRGWAQTFLGNYLDAESSLNTAVELDANNAIAYAYQAEVYALEYNNGISQIGTIDKAIELSKKAQQMGPDLMETHRARGVVLEITGNYEEAAAEYEAAIAINKNVGELHLSLGRIYRLLTFYDKAIEEFNRANTLNPTDPLPLTYISRTYALVGDYAKAIQIGEQAIQINPDDAYLYGNLGTWLYSNFDFEGSLANLRLAINGGETNDGVVVTGLPIDNTNTRVVEYYYYYALALARQGECKDAVEVADLILKTSADNEYAVANAEAAIDICRESNGLPPATSTVEGEDDGEIDAEATEEPSMEETPEP